MFFITVFVPAIFDLYPLNLTTGVVSITDGFKFSKLVLVFFFFFLVALCGAMTVTRGIGLSYSGLE